MGDSASTSAGHVYSALVAGIEDNTNGAEDGYFALEVSEGGSSSEKLRVTSSGNLGIGTTSPTGLLEISGGDGAGTLSIVSTANNVGSGNKIAFFGAGRSDTDEEMAFIKPLLNSNSGGSGNVQLGQLTFGTSGSERMRIDNSGNLLVGATSQTFGEKLHVTNSGSSANTGMFVFSSTDDRAVVITKHAGSASSTSRAHFAFLNSSNTEIGSIKCTGSATAYNTSSDARLKDVTGSARGLDVINNLNPVSYNWKADGKADEGLIAQEVEELVPNAVNQNEDGYYQMDYSKLVTHLIKGMQEQQKQIEQLKKDSHSPKGLEDMNGYSDLINTIKTLQAEISILKGE